MTPKMWSLWLYWCRRRAQLIRLARVARKAGELHCRFGASAGDGCQEPVRHISDPIDLAMNKAKGLADISGWCEKHGHGTGPLVIV
jgi:hypothetical protein